MTSARVDQRLQKHKPLWLSEIPLGTRAVRAIVLEGQEIARSDETQPTCDSSVQCTKADEATRPGQGQRSSDFYVKVVPCKLFWVLIGQG
jgi:hypothetical protein